MTDPTVVNRDLSLLAPKFRAAVEAALEECKTTSYDDPKKEQAARNNEAPIKQPLLAKVFEGFRGRARQEWLYAQGRTRPGKIVTWARTNLTSWHGYGLAVDIVHEKLFWNPFGDDAVRNDAWFKQVSDVFKKHKCSWGGNFSKPDTPHMQWGRCPASPSQAVIDLFASKGVGAVWDRLEASAASVVLPTVSAAQADEVDIPNYRSLVPGGSFSASPFDLREKRSIRTNNPGALNVSAWQKLYPGFSGVTQPDRAGNVTSIYATPEHGTGAWFYLLSKRYRFGDDGKFALNQLAMKYAGVANVNAKAVENYIKGWRAASGQALNGDSEIDLGDRASLLVLARAMFDHEAGKRSPLSDEQILFGVNGQKNNTLPKD